MYPTATQRCIDAAKNGNAAQKFRFGMGFAFQGTGRLKNPDGKALTRDI